MTRRKDPQPATGSTVAEPVAVAVAADTIEPAAQDSVAGGAVADPDPAAPSLPPAPPARRSGFLAPVLGGALAALGGFAVSQFDLLGLAAPDQRAELATLSASVAASEAQQAEALDRIKGELAALSDRIGTLETAPVSDRGDLSGLNSRLDALDRRLAAIEALPARPGGTDPALAAKVAELERRLAAVPAAGSSAEIQNRLDAALARLDAAETAARTRAAEAEAAAAAARRAESLDALARAVTDGRPFTPELQALADPALTSTLGPLAEAGVPTLATLQADFPAAAREALRVARASDAGGGWSERLVDFLAAQTGARPLTPRDGTSPGAILSRAEFALTEGRVADALAELAPLEDTVKAPLAGWVAAAANQVAAAAALKAARGE